MTRISAATRCRSASDTKRYQTWLISEDLVFVRSTVFPVEQVLHRFAAGFVGLSLGFALDGIHGELGAGISLFWLAAFGAAVGKAGLTRFEFKFFRADCANFDRESHSVNGIEVGKFLHGRR